MGEPDREPPGEAPRALGADASASGEAPEAGVAQDAADGASPDVAPSGEVPDAGAEASSEPRSTDETPAEDGSADEASAADGPAEDAPSSGAVPSERATLELPPRRELDDEPPTVEIEAVEPSRDAATLRRPTKPARRGFAARWARRLVVVALALGVALAIVLAVSFDSVARWYVLFAAEQRGITIDAREMDVTWGRASFWDATIRLEGAPALDIHVEWLEVQSIGLHPTSASMRGVDLEASTIDAVRQGLSFGRTHGGDLVPVTATDVRGAVAGGPGTAAELALKASEVNLEPGEALLAKGAVVEVARPKLVVGPVDAVADARGALLRVGLGTALATSPLRIDADLDARQLAVDLPATPASAIAEWMGRRPIKGAAPWPGTFSIRAKLSGAWTADARSELTGHVDATLIGIVPPHPPELNGIATGTDTQTAFDFRMGPRDEGIALDKLAVVVGALKLEGIGRVVPQPPSFVATANLRGSIPCRDLVGTVAVAQLGLALGSTLGSLVRQNVAGNVDVTVAIRVDGERVASPDVRPTASIGCRLNLL